MSETRVDKIEDLFGTLPFDLTEGQKEFLKRFTTSKGHCALGGDAGSGKTTIMELLKDFYGDEIIFCASTGVAAQQMPKRISNGTAHKALSLAFNISDETSLAKVKKPCQALLGSSDLVKIIAVDEGFALDSDHLSVMLARIERFNKHSRKRKKRQIRLLLIGDMLQRLPIASDERKEELTKRYGHWLMFKSKLWEEAKFQSYILDEVKRQGNSKEDKIFKECLQVFRYGQEHRYEGALKWINKKVNYNFDDANLLLAPTNKSVDIANNKALLANKNPHMTYTAVVSGKYNIKDCPADEVITLAKDLDIITLVNDEQGRWSNGLQGKVEMVCSDGCYVFFPQTQESHFVPIYEFTEEESYIEKDVVQPDGSLKDMLKSRVLGTCHQLQVKAAASFTFARSQGKTFTGKGTIDVGDEWLYTNKKMGDFGVAYVFIACSRYTSINNIELARPITKNHIKVCRESIDWWKEQLSKQKVVAITN